MSRLILFIMAIALATSCFSQTDFRKGFAITNAKDTLWGLIDYNEGARAYKSCTFKNATDQGAVSYTPHEIYGYGFVNGKYFESRLINEGNQKQNVFVEVKVKGAVSLYKFDYAFFVGKTGDSLTRLYNRVEDKVVNGQIVQWNTNEHIVILNWLLFDCADLRKRVQTTRLIERELVSLIEDYNQCTGKQSVTYNANTPWIKLRMGVVAGVSISSLSFSSPRTNFRHINGSFDIAVSPVIGLSFDILSPRVSERFSFQGDILYTKSKYENLNTIESYTSIERDYVTIELHQIKIPAGIRYTFPNKKITPFLSIGISTTLKLKSKSSWVQELEGQFNDIFIRDDLGEPLPIQFAQLGFWGSFGVMKSISNHLNGFIEIRYEKTNGLSYLSYKDALDLRSKIQNFQITLGLRKK